MGASHSFVTNPEHVASPSSTDPTQCQAYDYVICGGGTAGCVLASRLTEDPNVSVLLIEAGQSHEDYLFSRIPLAFPRLFHSPADWKFNTTPQNTLDGRQIYWPRGKVLGGSSSINALIYHHCAPDDFNEWEKLGATGWGYKDLLPYFKKSENYHPSVDYPGVNKENHGSDGPIHTSHKGFSAINQTIMETCKQIGVSYTDDLNTSRGTLGTTNFLGAVGPKGERSSAATGYLNKDVLARPNLTVLLKVMVEKVLFSQELDSDPRAVGVELSASATGPKYRVAARREILITAGAVGTPHILLMSGIGPSSELKAHDITVVKDLPAVGKNLSDHLSCGPMTLRAKPGATWDHLRRPLPGIIALVKWLAGGSGPMSGLATAGGAFIRSDDSSLPLLLPNGKNGPVDDLTSGPASPDIELVWAPIIVVNNALTPVPMDAHGVTVSAIALRPSSAGSITLKSASVWDAPVIDANYLASESDMNVIIRGTRFLLAMARMEPLRSRLDVKNLTSQDTNAPDYYWPGDADPEKVTDEQLKSWIRKNAAPSWHPVSSARMGQSETSSVVGPDLRVHGVRGLRVVDASVFPAQVSGHPCVVVIGVAEKAADMIKKAQSEISVDFHTT